MGETKAIREFTGWHMLAFVLLFFGTIIGVNIYMATMAITSWTGLAVQNSYVASQEFNDKLAASRAQAELNLKVDLSYVEGALIFSLLDEQNNPVILENVEIALTRPIGVHEDRILMLEPAGSSYSISEDLPMGVWNVVINALVPGKPDFNYRARLIVAPPTIPGV